ncbi:LOW QUALITY PROTEIN: hypothetical protein OSB04_024911, partial [Centaurea solstitialis]
MARFNRGLQSSPWLCMKRKFIMLSLLISGMPCKDINVFLEPLVDDLQLLFETGVETYDAHTQEMFTLHRKELDIAPTPMTGKEIYEEVKSIENSWGKGVKDTKEEFMQVLTGSGGKMKRIKNRFKWGKQGNHLMEEIQHIATTPYHCIDFMHVEKNVYESLIGTLPHMPGKTKDGLEARMDLVHFGLRPELEPKTQGNRTILPAACYTLTKEEKTSFLRVPQGYCSNFASMVSRKDRKLIGLKSHDYHIKEINVDELDKLQEELCVTLCLLEKYFPPSFFDIMVHLTVHLTREVKFGHVCFRWMYPFERCMKAIKGHVQNKNKPEGYIAEENVAEETIEYLSEYKRSMKTIGIPLNRHDAFDNGEDANSVNEEKPLSAGKLMQVCHEELSKAHFYVMQNTPEVEPYIKQSPHDFLKKTTFCSTTSMVKSKSYNEFQVEKEFAVDKGSIRETLRWISRGPHTEVMKYDAYHINGYLFRTKSHEGRNYQNSGVSVEATDMHICKEGVSYAQSYYYGVLQEIWIPLFKCDWVDNRHGVKKVGLGYTLVELKGHKDDPFIWHHKRDKTTPKDYRDAYVDVDEEFSTVVLPQNDNILPHVDPLDLGKESRDDYFRSDCR